MSYLLYSRGVCHLDVIDSSGWYTDLSFTANGTSKYVSLWLCLVLLYQQQQCPQYSAYSTVLASSKLSVMTPAFGSVECLSERKRI